MWYIPAMEGKVPAHILAQAHLLAIQGLSVERISFLLRLDVDIIKEVLRNPTVRVNTTEDAPMVSRK